MVSGVKTTSASTLVLEKTDEIELSPRLLELREKIKSDEYIENAILRIYLDQLRKNLLDKNATSATVVEIQDLLKSNMVQLDANQDFLLSSVLERLSNADTISALWGNDYEKAKMEILSILPEELADSVNLKFTAFESTADRIDNDQKKEQLNEILNYILGIFK